MESVKIGDAKMMVSLDKEDVGYLFPDSPPVKEMLLHITPGLLISGFGSPNDVIGYEVFEGADGGFELFITNVTKILSEKAEGGDDLRFSEIRGDERTHALTEGVKQNCALYSFSGLEDLLMTCRALYTSDLSSEAYYDPETSQFFLYLSEDSPVPLEFYGDKMPPSLIGSVAEHSKLISKNAHKTLAPLAKEGAS